MKTSLKTLLIAALAHAGLSVGANAAILYSGDFNGTYTSVTYSSLSTFTPTAGNKYGISATINASPFTWTADDQTGNATYIGFGSTLVFDGSSKALGSMANNYVGGGAEYLFVNFINDTGSGTGKPGNQLVATTTVAVPYGPINVGVLLDTTAATWSLSYFTGGTGFNDTAAYQGGSLMGTVTGIDPTKVNNGIHFTYVPVNASGSEAQSVVSNFKVVDAIPEPSSFALVVGGIANLLLIRRRRVA